MAEIGGVLLNPVQKAEEIVSAQKEFVSVSAEFVVMECVEVGTEYKSGQTLGPMPGRVHRAREASL